MKDRKENWQKGIMDLLQQTIVSKEFNHESQENEDLVKFMENEGDQILIN